jgi:hypothetical protein
MNTITFPNGWVFTSTALTPSQMDVLLQSLSTQMLGIAATDPQVNFKVRLSWQTSGAPAFTIDDDVIFIRAIEATTPYSEVRDERMDVNPDGTATRTRTYSRMWNVFFRARGPNSFDTIRQIKSMLLEDFIHDSFAQSKLYMITAMSTPVRAPELYEGRWWEQVDFDADFLEQVDETLTVDTVNFVEVFGQSDTGATFDLKVNLGS